METNNINPDFSYGTLAVYNRAYQMLAGRDEIDTIFVNLDTIIRNVISQHITEESRLVKNGDKKLSDAIEHIGKIAVQECGSFLYELAALLSRTSSVELRIFAYRYFYHFMIPEKYLRIKHDCLTLGVRDYVNKKLGTEKPTYAKYNNVTLCDAYYEGSNLIRALENELKSIVNQHNVLMVSYHPIDYHIAPACNTWRVIKSFTGQVWTFDDLGTCVLNCKLPYLRELHILLGDKTDLKPALRSKDREKLLALADSESWNLLPEDKLKETLRKHLYLTPYSI